MSGHRFSLRGAACATMAAGPLLSCRIDIPGEIEEMAAPVEVFIDPDKALVRTFIQRHDHLPILRVLGADDQKPVLQVSAALAFEQRHFGCIVLDVQGAPRTAGKEVGRQPDDGMRPCMEM